MNKRTLLLVPADEFLVLSSCFIRENSCNDLDARVSQSLKALPGHDRVGIFYRTNDALYPGIDQRLGAGRRAAAVMMRLERNVGSAAFCAFAGVFKCDLLGMDDVVVDIG